MAQINFYANVAGNAGTDSASGIAHTLGSGIGFYGSAFGVSVPVGSQQSSTWTTNDTGTIEGVQLNNTAQATVGDVSTTGTVSSNNLTAINLDKLPNYLCPLNIRFTHDEAVKVQNCKLRIFDRNSITNQASGVTTYVWEARHPSTSQSVTQLSHRGRSENYWHTFDPVDAMADMAFTSSPGMSGLNTNTTDSDTSLGYTSTEGVTHVSDRHDWYVALSSEPQSIGSKTAYGLYFSVEYL